MTINPGHEPGSKGQIHCTVVRSGTPVPGADLTIVRDDPWPPAQQTAVTPVSGEHPFRMVAAGTWSFAAREGDDVVTGSGELGAGESVAVTIDLDELVENAHHPTPPQIRQFRLRSKAALAEIGHSQLR